MARVANFEIFFNYFRISVSREQKQPTRPHTPQKSWYTTHTMGYRSDLDSDTWAAGYLTGETKKNEFKLLETSNLPGRSARYSMAGHFPCIRGYFPSYVLRSITFEFFGACLIQNSTVCYFLCRFPTAE